MSSEYVVNDSGERVIAASRRPDGTIRKERKVRAGYVPQEEQQAYQSRGVQMRQNVPKCPGFEEEAAAPPKPKTKAAAKNEKRKQKKLEEKGPADAGSGGAVAAAPSAAQRPQQGANATEAAAAALHNLSVSGGEASAEGGSVEKQIRALKKKVRQAEGLAAKKAEGKALTEEEELKLSKLKSWEEEVRQLEAQL